MKHRMRTIVAAVAIAVGPVAVNAQAFNVEAPSGFYAVGGFTLNNSGQTLGIEAPGGVRYVPAIGSIPGLTASGITGFASASLAAAQVPLVFSFLLPVQSVTFAFGDANADDDGLATVEAFIGSTSLGVFTSAYGTATTAGSLPLTFSGAGASSFALSSGGSNPNSLYWNVTASTRVPTSTVPEPSTYALMAAGLLGLTAIARRRQRA